MKQYTLEQIEEALETYIDEHLRCPEVSDVAEQGADPDEIQGCIKCVRMLIRELPKYLGVWIFFAITAHAQMNLKTIDGPTVAIRKDEFIVKYKKKIKDAEVIDAREQLALLKMDRSKLIQTLTADDVEWIEPNYLYTVLETPSDAETKQLWGMKKIGMEKVWGQVPGDSKNLIGIIDTGVDFDHEDLKANVESRGFNAITGDESGYDDNGHGTHVAGTIGAVGGNAIGVVGVNLRAGMFGAKFLSHDGSGTAADAIKAINWAVDHGARVLNNSWGGGGYSKALYETIARACEKGVTFVAAAGNGGMDGIGDNNDVYPSYPASYDLPCVISVAATDEQDKLTRFSNYGKKTVHVAAPGFQILSTFPDNKYATASGTSMASPHVTGVVGLLLSVNHQLTPMRIKEILMQTAEPMPLTFWQRITFSKKQVASGRIDAHAAVIEASK